MPAFPLFLSYGRKEAKGQRIGEIGIQFTRTQVVTVGSPEQFVKDTHSAVMGKSKLYLNRGVCILNGL